MFLNDKRLCDSCIFMADSCHLDMCLHPLRRDVGSSGKMIENALVWNGNCSVYIKGTPCFYLLFDSSGDFKEIEAYAEIVRLELAKRFVKKDEVTAFDLAEALQIDVPS